MKFINLTRRTEIGANSYYFEAAGQRLVLDSGMHPKEEGEESLPNFRALGDRKLDAIVLSHAHLDHVGTLPVLMRRQPTARIFMTEATAEIGSALLHNSVNVMTRQREELGVVMYPLFTHRETDRATDQWRSCPWRQPFALDETQEAVGMIYKFRREGLLGEFPVYIGGLSVKMTEIYDRRALTTRRLLPRLQLLEEVAPFVLNGQTIHDSPARGGRLYALSSGMMTPKTLSNIFARRVLEDPRHSIFFVGYADPESPAGLIRAAKPGDLVTLDPDEPPQRLACQIEQFQFSAHASRESIVRYVKQLAPKKIVLVHGDMPAVSWTHAQLAAALPESGVIVPVPGVEMEL